MSLPGVEARREDWRRHVKDLVTRSYEGAAERSAREEIFHRAFELTTPVATRVLEKIDELYLGGTGHVSTSPPAPDGDGGLLGSWDLTWPLLEQARNRFTGGPLPPVQLFAMFPRGFTHPHLVLFDIASPRCPVASWPMQVTSAEDAERQEIVLWALAEAEVHERTFAGDLNWRLLPMDAGLYRERGFVIRPAVLFGAELDEVRTAVEESCARIVELAATKAKEEVFGGAVAFSEIPELGVSNLVWEGPNLDLVKVVEPVTQVDERLTALWEHPALVELARMALGVDEVAPFTDKFNAKRARAGGEFLWHQDHPFWYSIIREQARETVTLGLFLDDATAANGALVVVPGSHGGPAPRKKDADDVMTRYHADTGAIDTTRAVVAEVPAGGVLAFSPFLLHRSGPNTTAGDRRVLFLTYQPAGRQRLAEFDYEAALLEERWMDELP